MKLTPRQTDVLGEWLKGRINKQIAFELGLSSETVKIHLRRIYRKMGVLDCVAKTSDQYVDIAVRLATETDYRAGVRDKILAARDRIYEDVEAARELEKFLIKVARPSGSSSSRRR